MVKLKGIEFCLKPFSIWRGALGESFIIIGHYNTNKYFGWILKKSDFFCVVDDK